MAFHTFLLALKEVRGERAVELTRAELTPELRDRLRLGAISRVGYYPIATYSELHAAVQRALGSGEVLARELGRQATEIDVRGLLRFVVGFASAALLMQHAGRVWSSYARGAKVLVEKLAERRYSIDFQGMTGASELVFAEMEGSIEKLVELTGAVHSSVRREPGRDGGSAHFTVAWGEG